MLSSFFLLFCIIHTQRVLQKKEADWITSFIGASIGWVMYLYGVTEILSVFHVLEKNSLLIVWGIPAMALLFLLLLRKRYMLLWNGIKNMARKLKQAKLICGIVIGYSAFVLLLSCKTIPYNWDSMTYHLPRICHWVQNKSVGHYATNVIRQVGSPVMHEFVNLHVYILWEKNELFLNFLQCFSYLINAGMVYGIAQRLQCSKKFCRIAALLYLALPIAFAEALTTQNDNFATIWLLYFTYILVDFVNPKQKLEWKKETILRVCALGMLVSLGYLTKPSVCIGMAVMVLWILVVCIVRRDSVITIMKFVCVAIPTIVLPLIPEAMRNIRTFTALSVPMAGQRQLIGTINPFYVVVNFLKNFLYNLPNVYFYSSDYLLMRLIQKTADVLHVDLNASSISEDGGEFMVHVPQDYGHDTALNPIIIMLLIFFILFAIIHIRKKKIKDMILGYSFVSVVCFCVFCSVLRWEPFVSRYMSAYFALLCPMVALQLEKMNIERLRSALIGIICFLCVAEIFSMSRYHRDLCAWHGAAETPSGYFLNRTGDYEIYTALTETIQDHEFKNIGLKIKENSYEYPIWRMLKEDVAEIEHVYVENETAKYDNGDFIPDCIIWLGQRPEGMVEHNGKEYKNVITFETGYYLFY